MKSDYKRKLLVVAVALAAVVVPASGASAVVAEPEGIIEGPITNEVSPGVFEIESIAYAVKCTIGETFLGRINARVNGETIFIGKVSGDCQGSSPSLRNTRPNRPMGTFMCGDQVVMRGQGRTSGGERFKFPVLNFICL